MIKFLFKKLKRYFKSPSQFLVSLERGEYNKPYAHYFYSLLNNANKKVNKIKENSDVIKKHEKIRERMLELANVNKTKYKQDEYTKNFFDLLERSEKIQINNKKKSVFLKNLEKKIDHIKNYKKE